MCGHVGHASARAVTKSVVMLSLSAAVAVDEGPHCLLATLGAGPQPCVGLGGSATVQRLPRQLLHNNSIANVLISKTPKHCDTSMLPGPLFQHRWPSLTRKG